MNKQILRTSKVIQLTAAGLCGQKTENVGERRVAWQRWLRGMLAGVVGVGVALALVSCKSSAPARGARHEIHPEADVAVNTEQARLRMRGLVGPFCGGLESAADEIIAGTTNRAVQREALLWKIEAVPTVRETLFHANPFMAMGDTWVLLWQMADYFQNGPGKQALGDSAQVAAAECESLEKQLTEVAASFTHSGNVSDVRGFVQKWAGEHPIEHSIAGRESVVSYFTKRKLQETFSAPEAAGDFVVTMDDVSRRMDVYSGELLQQSRWQAELFAMNLASEYQLQSLVPLAGKAVESVAMAANVGDRTVGSLDRTAAALEKAPEIIARERAAALQAVIEFGQQEPRAIFEQLTKERVAALVELNKNITEERIAFTADLQRLSFDVVDRVFLRMAQLGAVFALVMFGAVVVLLLLTRRWFLTKRGSV
jgi:hypothetical protein